MRNDELWARLQAHAFDGPGSAPFSVKLARAEGWTPAYTARVIEEYRRFLYLTQISPRQVTPSQIVDAAWHMHLTFTRDYWEVLCPKVIGKPVHHQPCAGEEEMPRYRDQFAATKALYEAEFGAEPPVDIWGRDRAKSARRMVMSEAGMASPTMIAFLPFVICLVLLFIEPSLLMFAMTVFTGIMFFVVLMNPRRRRRGRRDARKDRELDEWVEFDDEGHDDTGSPTESRSNSGPSTGGRSQTSVASKRSQRDDDDTRDKSRDSGTGGLFGFFGGGDSDGDSGGGCGGCGGGD